MLLNSINNHSTFNSVFCYISNDIKECFISCSLWRIPQKKISTIRTKMVVLNMSVNGKIT